MKFRLFSTVLLSLTYMGLGLSMSGCAGHPLGSDWTGLDTERQEERALDAVRTMLWLCKDNEKASDIVILRINRRYASFVARSENEWIQVLFYRDIEKDDIQDLGLALLTNPGEITARIHLKPDSLSATTARAKLPRKGWVFASPYLEMKGCKEEDTGRFLAASQFLDSLPADEDAIEDLRVQLLGLHMMYGARKITRKDFQKRYRKVLQLTKD